MAEKSNRERELIVSTSDWHLTALSAQMGYMVPLKCMLQLNT